MLINGEEGCENELNDSNFRDCFKKKKKKAAKFGFFHTKMGLILGLLTDNNVYPGSNQW